MPNANAPQQKIAAVLRALLAKARLNGREQAVLQAECVFHEIFLPLGAGLTRQ